MPTASSGFTWAWTSAARRCRRRWCASRARFSAGKSAHAAQGRAGTGGGRHRKMHRRRPAQERHRRRRPDGHWHRRAGRGRPGPGPGRGRAQHPVDRRGDRPAAGGPVQDADRGGQRRQFRRPGRDLAGLGPQGPQRALHLRRHRHWQRLRPARPAMAWRPRVGRRDRPYHHAPGRAEVRLRQPRLLRGPGQPDRHRARLREAIAAGRTSA